MIVLVRHGEATHHTLKMTGGWTDSVLTETGRQQIEAVAERLACDLAGRKQRLRILSSDLKRAVESAQIIASGLSIPDKVELCSFLREKNNGIGAGLTEAKAKQYFIQPVEEGSINHRNYPGGETRKEFFHRSVGSLWDYVDMEHEDLIIVAHKGTIQNIIFKWLGMNMEQVAKHNFSVDIRPASVSVIGVNRWREHTVFLLNDLSHIASVKGFGISSFKYGKI